MSVVTTYRSRLLSLCYLVGAVLSGISLWHLVKLKALPEAGPSFCNINSTFNCDAVTASPFSVFLSLPLASWGLLFYLGLWVFHIAALDGRRVRASTAIDVQFVAALLASILSLILFGISELFIGALCLVCIGMYVVNFALLIVTWRMGSARPVTARIVGGVRGVARFPAALAGRYREELPHSVLAGWAGVLLGGLIVVAVLALPGSFYAALLALNPGTPARREPPTVESVVAGWREQPSVEIPLNLRSGIEVDHGKGSPLAPVRIVEFLDYECPACRRLYNSMQEVLHEYPDQVYVVLRNYPLDTSCNPSLERELHKSACYSAIFARCAGEQGKFWEATDFLFGLEEFDHGASPEAIRAAIDRGTSLLGLDPEAMRECADAPRHREKILDDIREGNVLGVAGTPSLWINNRPLVHPSPYAIKAVIDYVLGAERAS